MPKKKWISLENWQQKEMEHRRNEVLIAIRALAMAFLSGEDLTEYRIGQQLVEIGNAITECGITDEMVNKAVEEVRREMKFRDNDDVAEHFSNIVYVRDPRHKMDTPPEFEAMRVKHAAHVVGGHALAKKLAGTP
jgi:hypothetical protein